MSLQFSILGKTHELDIVAHRPMLELAFQAKTYKVARHENSIEIDGKLHDFVAVRDGNDMHIRMGGRNWVVHLIDPRDAAQTGTGADSVNAPMPGMLVSVEKPAGALVTRGEPILTIESMKLQLTLEAPRDGTIKEVFYEEGESFAKGATLFAMIEQEEAI